MSVGESLAAAREQARLSVEDVSRATRIRGVLIREIEADGVAMSGGPVYARGHIRAIATHLGLDPEPLLVEFDRLHGSSHGPGARQIFEREVLAEPDRKGPNWTAAMAVAAAVLLVVAVTALFTDRSPDSSPVAEGVPQTAASSDTTTSPAAQAPVVSATPGPDIALAPQGGVFLRVRVAGDRSYVLVRQAGPKGSKVFEGTLTTGAVKDFRSDQPLYLVLGNAGAVTLVVNGRDLGSPGGPGQVVRTTFGPGDPAGAAG